jgi:hypothetical protein
MRSAIVALLLASSLGAADWSKFYDASRLSNEKPRLEQELSEVEDRDIKPYFTRSQLLAFSGLELAVPVSNELAGPLAIPEARNNRITLPVVSLLFVEDLAQAYAWLWTSGFSSETVDEYCGMLRYRSPEEFSGRRYPAPLEALHVPANVVENPTAKRMFARIKNNALAFLILREFARARRATSGATSDEQADVFALDLLKRNSEIPFGPLLILEAQLYLPGSGETPTAGRLVALANYLDLRVQEFVAGRPDRNAGITAIHSMARRFRASAAFLGDREGQRLWSEQARKTTVESLAPRRQSDASVDPAAH